MLRTRLRVQPLLSEEKPSSGKLVKRSAETANNVRGQEMRLMRSVRPSIGQPLAKPRLWDGA